MNKNYNWPALLFFTFWLLVSCTSKRPSQQDLITDTFPEAQEDIREVIKSIKHDAETANIDGLQAAHLDSEKFTKFGPRNFDRQDVDSANKSEADFFGSISNYKLDIRDLKINVFGYIAIATYYPQVSFMQNGKVKKGSGRQTFVFLKTAEGWKIVHEHGTPHGFSL